jgi:hypothetical protein
MSGLTADLIESAAERIRIAFEGQRRREPSTRWARHPSFGDQPVEVGTAARRRPKFCDRPIAVSHQQPLAILDAPQIAAEVLPEFGDSDTERRRAANGTVWADSAFTCTPHE